jgi:hypothetical protein
MSEINHEANLEARAALFKALGHPVRLLIVNLVGMRPRHNAELAEILNLTTATVAYHLKQLEQARVLQPEESQYILNYRLNQPVLSGSLADLVQLPQPALTMNTEQDAFRQKVLKAFFKHGRLVQIPSQRKKRQMVLEKIVDAFEPGRPYDEMEVNHILLEFHDDVASLRRGMIEVGLFTREKGVYRRVVG